MDTSVRDYEAALAKAPESIRSRVSPCTSTGDYKTGQWFLRDANGVEIWRTPLPPPPVDVTARYSASQPALDTKAQKSQKLFRQLILSTARTVEVLHERIVELEQQLATERRGIVFRGAWQVAIDYEFGAIVTYNERAYVASKAIRSGGQPPARHGSGWLHMFDSTEIPR